MLVQEPVNVKASILVTIGRRPLPRKRSRGFGSNRTSDQKGTPRTIQISELITLKSVSVRRTHVQAAFIRAVYEKFEGVKNMYVFNL